MAGAEEQCCRITPFWDPTKQLKNVFTMNKHIGTEGDLAIAGMGGVGIATGGTTIVAFCAPPEKRPILMAS